MISRLRARLSRWAITAIARTLSGDSNLANPAAWLVEFFHGGGALSGAGVAVSPETAQRQATVYACCQVLSQDLAKLPLILYRRVGENGRVRATKHPLYKLARGRWANLSSFNARQMSTTHLALRGNGYVEIERGRRGAVAGLNPLHPDRVTVKLTKAGDLTYTYQPPEPGAKRRIILAEDMVHLKENVQDGYVGRSRITALRESVGLAMAAERHGSKLFANGAFPGVVIKHPGKVEKPGRRVIADEFEEGFGGENKFRPFVAAEGSSVEKIGMTNEDAQFLETRGFQAVEVARIFRVPPHKVGILDKATFSNIEQQSLEYVGDTLLPLASLWEQELDEQLLTEDEREEFFFEFLFDALLRADFKTRMEGYAMQRQWGLASPNDIGRRENWNPIAPKDGGDTYLRPTTHVPADTPVEAPKAPAAAPADPAEDPADDAPEDPADPADAPPPAKTVRLVQ